MPSKRAIYAKLMFAVIVLGSLIALGYTSWLRVRLVPAELGYIPAEANVILATGDIESLWDGFDFHFGAVLREDGHTGFLTETLDGIAETLSEASVPVERKSDLRYKYGIDTTRGLGLGLSIYPSLVVDVDAEGLIEFVALIPVAQAGDWAAQVVAGHTGPVFHATFAPDGERVVTASGDGTARIWSRNVEGAWSAEVLAGHGGPVLLAAFDPDGQRVLTASEDGTARVWSRDAAGGWSAEVLAGHDDWVQHAAFAPDGERAVTGSWDGMARVWSRNSEGAWSAEVLAGHDGVVYHAAFASDGRRVLTASEDSTARVWSRHPAGGWSVEVLAAHDSGVQHAQFAPDGQRILTASADGTARVWTMGAGGGWSSQVLAGHTGSVFHAAFDSTGNRVVTASADGTGRVWTESADGGWSAQVLTGHDGAVLRATFDPGGKRVVTASEDSTARVWTEGANGDWSAQVLGGHDNWVYHAAFDLDGERVLTASEDGTARLSTTIGSKSAAPPARLMSPKKELIEFLAVILEEEPDTNPCAEDSLQDSQVTGLGDFVVVFPSEELALFSNSCRYLGDAISNRSQNLTQMRHDDRFFQALRFQLRRPLFAGAGALAHLRGIALEFAPVGSATATLNFTPDLVQFVARADTDFVGLRWMESFLEQPPAEQRWRKLLEPESLAVALIRDADIPDYLRLLKQDEEWGDTMDSEFGGILDGLSSSSQLEQALLAVTQFNEGIPFMLLGLWGDRDELSRQVRNTQLRLREDRDRAVLTGLHNVWSSNHEEEPGSTGELLESDSVDDRPACGGASDLYWLNQYEFADGAFVPQPVNSEPFGNSDYVHAHRDRKISFLEPCVTENDLRYRLRVPADDEALDRLVSLQREVELTQAGASENADPAAPNLGQDLHEAIGILEEMGTAGRILARDRVQSFRRGLDSASPGAVPNELAQGWTATAQFVVERLSRPTAGEEMLLDNRYRLVSTLLDDALWVASSRMQLERLIDRHAGTVSSRGFDIGADGRSGKAGAFLNVPSMIERGLLSGESELQEGTEKFLLDFRYHPEVLLSVRSLRGKPGIELALQALGPVAMESR